MLCWLGRAARNRHRHAIEQVSRRWRGGRRDDSARTRRKKIDFAQVETKDFIERSLFVKEDGRWLYLKGDPDFEPRNVRVDGPLDPKPKPPKRKSAKKPAVSRSRAPVSR